MLLLSNTFRLELKDLKCESSTQCHQGCRTCTVWLWEKKNVLTDITLRKQKQRPWDIYWQMSMIF